MNSGGEVDIHLGTREEGFVEREGELREREREDALLLYSSSKVEELI